MMNGRLLYEEPFHPFNQHLTLDGKRLIYPKYLRSQTPIRYYYIDFGYAKWFRDPSEPRVVTGTRAREVTPEQLPGEPYDPFKADIFQLGAILRRDLIPVCITLVSCILLARVEVIISTTQPANSSSP
jgi:serine/threonine protein kinase